MTHQNLFRHYLKKLAILSLVVAVAYAALWVLFPAYASVSGALIIPYFVLISAVFHRYLLQSTGKGSARKFVTRFMGGTTAKLLIYMATLLVFTLLNKEEALNFVITFFIVYIIYTFFEVNSFLKQSKEIQSEG